MSRFTAHLQSLKEKGRYRVLKASNGVDFSSNDYLGLSDARAVRLAIQDALNQGIPFSSGASRLLRGHHAEHVELERAAAVFTGFDDALYFASGYQANLALFSTLPGRKDIVLYDERIHACVKDGLRTGFAKYYGFKHNDHAALEEALRRYRSQADMLWIAAESLYSMDGDFAPVQDILSLAERYDAEVIIDEAHATGVWGHEGRGLCYDLPKKRLTTIHTCGKALGSAGGLICGASEKIDYLINAARPFIYSTAPPPVQAFITRRALDFVLSGEGQSRRAQLKNLCALAQKRFGGPGSQIVPLIIGEDKEAVACAGSLQERGYDIRAIRPPTVAEGTARLRLSLNAKIDSETLKSFCDIYDEIRLQEAAA